MVWIFDDKFLSRQDAPTAYVDDSHWALVGSLWDQNKLGPTVDDLSSWRCIDIATHIGKLSRYDQNFLHSGLWDEIAAVELGIFSLH